MGSGEGTFFWGWGVGEFRMSWGSVSQDKGTDAREENADYRVSVHGLKGLFHPSKLLL